MAIFCQQTLTPGIFLQFFIFSIRYQFTFVTVVFAYICWRCGDKVGIIGFYLVVPLSMWLLVTFFGRSDVEKQLEDKTSEYFCGILKFLS